MAIRLRRFSSARLGFQPVLAHDAHRARLCAVISHLFRVGHARADAQARERIIEHAVAVKIHFLTVLARQKSEIAGWIDANDGADFGRGALFDPSLCAPDLILQLAPRVLECVIDRECRIAVPLIGGGVLAT